MGNLDSGFVSKSDFSKAFDPMIFFSSVELNYCAFSDKGLSALEVLPSIL